MKHKATDLDIKKLNFIINWLDDYWKHRDIKETIGTIHNEITELLHVTLRDHDQKTIDNAVDITFDSLIYYMKRTNLIKKTDLKHVEKLDICQN